MNRNQIPIIIRGSSEDITLPSLSNYQTLNSNILGTGGFGEVKLVKEKNSGIKYAIKI